PEGGGFVATHDSLQWAFRISVLVAPVAVVGARLFKRRSYRGERTLGIDVPGALLVAAGMFLLVFGLSEGGTYGWLTARRHFVVGGQVLWSAAWPISVVPVVFGVAAAILVTFVLYERAKERRLAR